MAQSISEQTALAQTEDINQRELPEFFIRINVIPVIAYEQQLGKMTQQQVFHSEVFGEMIDRAGGVIYSARATDEIKETISEGMGFSLDARKEIALKNAFDNWVIISKRDSIYPVRFKSRVHRAVKNYHFRCG